MTNTSELRSEVRLILDVPGGPVFESPPVNSRVRPLIRDLRTKIPHTMEQISPHTKELTSRSRAHALQQGKPPQQEACTAQGEEPCWPQVEKTTRSNKDATHAKKAPHSQRQVGLISLIYIESGPFAYHGL